MDSNLTIYFDMDGVLAKYDRNGYIATDEQPVAPFLQPGGHYFLNLEPDEKAIEALRLLNEKLTVKVLTAIPKKGSLFLEHAKDKIKWLNKYCPFINTDEQFIATATDKGAIAKSITDYDSLGLSNFSINHILIDDYNNNLDNWVYKGGTALKYSNGINSEDSWNGLVLDKAMSAEDIFDLITNFLNYL